MCLFVFISANDLANKLHRKGWKQCKSIG